LKNEKDEFIIYLMRSIRVIFGCFLIALADSMFIKSALGLNAFNVLINGLSLNLNITIGRVSQIVGLSFIIIGFMLKIIPGLGTILNMYFCGFFTDIILKNTIVISLNTAEKFIMLPLGIIILNLGIFIYLKQGLGGGPRDGVFLYIALNAKITIGKVKMFIEFLALIIGFLLGGKVGIGTVFISLLSGPILDKIAEIFKINLKLIKQQNIYEVFIKLFNISKIQV